MPLCLKAVSALLCLGASYALAQDATPRAPDVAQLSQELQQTRADLAESKRQIEELRQSLEELRKQVQAGHPAEPAPAAAMNQRSPPPTRMPLSSPPKLRRCIRTRLRAPANIRSRSQDWCCSIRTGTKALSTFRICPASHCPVSPAHRVPASAPRFGKPCSEWMQRVQRSSALTLLRSRDRFRGWQPDDLFWSDHRAGSVADGEDQPGLGQHFAQHRAGHSILLASLADLVCNGVRAGHVVVRQSLGVDSGNRSHAPDLSE